MSASSETAPKLLWLPGDKKNNDWLGEKEHPLICHPQQLVTAPLKPQAPTSSALGGAWALLGLAPSERVANRPQVQILSCIALTSS